MAIESVRTEDAETVPADGSGAPAKTGPEDGRRVAAAARRRRRTAEILAATRALFDQRGVRDAQIEDVARAVGINRAIIYRHFTGKEDLFALTLAGYLDDLEHRLHSSDDASADPETRLRRLVAAFFDFGMEYPAFVDCAQTLMRRPGAELFAEVSQDTMVRLGAGIVRNLSLLKEILAAGNQAGMFHSPDVDLTANTLYSTGLGSLQLARLGYLVTEASPGVPAVASVEAAQVRDRMVAAAVAMARDGA